MPQIKTGSAWLVIFAISAIAAHQIAVYTLAHAGERDSAKTISEEIGKYNLDASLLAVAGQFSSAASKTEQVIATNGSAMMGTLDPFTTLIKKEGGAQTYKVKRGETLQGIAKKFGISVETIKTTNPSISSKVAMGQTLSILPVSGILYPVSENDTLQLIAERYNVDSNLVKIYNPNYIDVLTSGNGTLILPNAISPVVTMKLAATSTNK
ncbi:MAG: LysM peptidoglycan-binding domain-containing protein [Candidatus Jorgensenbacteria bacterium]|nr:LysM peptidoglycan-binding domain-containing protein [Candidatus Jorgensenbacteria bacterium]